MDIDEYAHKGGRPFGGIGKMWKRNAQFKFTAIDYNDSHHCLAVRIDGFDVHVVCVNEYLPNFVNNDQYEEEILNNFAFVKSVFGQELDGQSKCLLIGDFNFDMKRLYNSNRLGIVCNFVSEHDLMVCDNLNENMLGYIEMKV